MQATLSFNNAMGSMSRLPLLGRARALPDAKLAYSEGQIGWIPYILERADDVWNQHRGGPSRASACPSRRRPTTSARCTAASSATSTASKSLDAIGVDNITFETDYPHSDSTWPDTKKIAEEMFAGPRRRQDCYKIVRGNAIRMFSLDLAE